MITMKFGGAVLQSPEGFRQMASIVRDRANTRCLVVVSAFSSTTRDLEFIARLALQGALNDSLERLRHLIDDHRLLVRALIADATTREALAALLDDCLTVTSSILKGIAITRQRSARVLDEVLAIGEFMALHIARHVLVNEGIRATSIDARSVMITSDTYGVAEPLISPTEQLAQRSIVPLFDVNDVVVTQGFVGRTESGNTTTMGKESSNLTASVLGSALGAKEIVIWTDVQGLRSGDPDVCGNTQLRPQLTWHDARIAAHAGVKVLYPTMIEPAERAGIPIRIAMAAQPDGEDSVLGVDAPPCASIVVLTDDVETQRSRVTTVFPAHKRWLTSVLYCIQKHNLDDDFTCAIETPRQLAHIEVPLHSGRSFARTLHEQLIEST